MGDIGTGAIARRLEGLEDLMHEAPVRFPVGGLGAGDGIETFMEFPEIPVDEATIIYLVSSVQTFIPGNLLRATPSELDTYWWAVPGDTRWHPIGGKLSGISGVPGMISLR